MASSLGLWYHNTARSPGFAPSSCIQLFLRVSSQFFPSSLDFSRTSSGRVPVQISHQAYFMEKRRSYLSYNPLVLSALQKAYISIQHVELTDMDFRDSICFQQLVCAFRNLNSLTCRGVHCMGQFDGLRQPAASEGSSRVIRYTALRLTRLVVSLTSPLQ